MKVGIIGSGGREHALALKLFNSYSCDKVYCFPGNPGTASFAKNLNVSPEDFEKLAETIILNGIDFVVIGPEKHLSDGLTDYLQTKGIKVFGPTSAAARIESDKAFAKQLMLSYKIPTASFRTFTADQHSAALEFCNKIGYPSVIKASGLAAGKGVVIANNPNEAKSAIDSMFFEKMFGESGETIVVEEFMTGLEASVFAICDGNNFVLLPPAQDHKRIGDNDTGKNTGGMGAYAPAKIVTKAHLQKIEEQIVSPVLKALSDKGSKFVGCLFCGLMIEGDVVRVVEFNARFGDPETQAILNLLEGDFCELLYSCATGELKNRTITINGNASVCVIAASGGYPDKFNKGFEIKGLDRVSSDIYVFHSGTALKDDKIISNGGRVLGVTSVDSTGNLKSAIEMAYEAISKISFDKMYYRKDIGSKGLN
ncbi:MAG: phosphoribosylamine--glycine ligase [Ignavibacteriaceae bacterium]|nr:phosphoribosylamine--glycine ligase [Ignavibacteriaceae bacterium]